MTLWEFAIFATVTLFVVVEPISLIPLFLGMTPGNSPRDRVRMAGLACGVACLVLLVFALAGKAVFAVFGISLPAFQIAGGILLFTIGLDMLRAHQPEGKFSPEEQAAAVAKDDIAITPLAIPLIAGPGGISTVLLLQGEAADWVQNAIVYGVILLVCGASYIILALSAKGAGWVSPILLKIVQRLAGLLVATLAVQFVVNGVSTILRDLGIAG